jgi:spectinomycin phosphotransferase
MLEKPDLENESIIACLNDEYGLHVAKLAFLPFGADRNAAAYRVVSDDGMPYFLKLRRGGFNNTSLVLSAFLSDQGIEQTIAPQKATTGGLWASLDAFRVVLYPFIEGRNGYETCISACHWRKFGAALKRIHNVAAPPALISRIPPETYSPKWREMTKAFLGLVEDGPFDEPVAQKLAAFLMAKCYEILDLVSRAEQLAQALEARPLEFVLCHSDLHAGNILIGSDDAFYIVDWDEPILAPKERDLMFVGGAQGFAGHSLPEEVLLFYQGYGETQIDPTALAYYRYERIIQDIAAFCQQILLTNEGGADRQQSLRYLTANFLPNSTIEIARQSEKALREG